METEGTTNYFVIETGLEFSQPLMQKLEGNESAILCWRTEADAKRFLQKMDSSRTAGFRVLQVGEAYLIKLQQEFKQIGIAVLLRVS